MIKVIIVEDIKPVREGLSALVNAQEELECSASYESCEDMLEELREKKPDVILMDINLEGISGVEGVKLAKKILPKVNVIMLTVNEDSANIFESLISGAAGYLLKTTPPAQIIEAVKDAYNGGSPMNSSIAAKVIDMMRIIHSKNKKDETIKLSVREREILEKISNGAAYKNVADELFISIHTVRYHIRNIYEKLQVGSQSEAVAAAIKRGLI